MLDYSSLWKNLLNGKALLKWFVYDTPGGTAVYLTVKLNTVYNRASNQHTFKGSPLLIGSTVKLNLDSLLVEGLVTHIEGAPDPRTKIPLLIKAQVIRENPTYPESSGERSFIADALSVGDKVTDNQQALLYC